MKAIKKNLLLFAVVLLSLPAVAQYVVPKGTYVEGHGYGYGLYNERTGRWVLGANYHDMRTIGNYNGCTYYAAQDHETLLWGVIRSDNYRKLHVSCKYVNLEWQSNIFSGIPIIGAQKKNDWGLLGLESVEGDVILPFSYRSINLYPLGPWMSVTTWGGNTIEYQYDQMVKLYNDQMKAAKERQILEEKERQERLAREKKEKELASFTLYAKQYVTPKVNEWQQKGEFEKIADYQVRVTGPNREEKIRLWTKEAEDKFIQENAALDPLRGITLEVYDSENEVFSVRSPKFGQLLVPVPIAEGAAFKQNFGSVTLKNPVYFINEDKIALKSLSFYDSKQNKTYYYNNQMALNYKQYEIDVDLLDIDPVRIVSSTTMAPPPTHVAKPICEILSPANGSTYSTPTIQLRYHAKVAPNTSYSVSFTVAGKDVEPISSETQSGTNSKGAQLVEGTMAELPMPQEIGKSTVVGVQVIDAYGQYAEPKKIEIKYVGEKPKPTLHIFAVGISDYPAKDLSNLNYAAKDARDFVQTITTSDVSMYREVKSTLLLDKDATTANLRRELTQLASRVAQGDVVMLFFSGHGVKQDDERYFMTSNASAEEYYNGLEFGFIRRRMSDMYESKLCRVLVFMDACHSGAMLGAKGYTKDITLASPGIIGFYSSTASEQSAETDKLQNGVFTRVLLDGLKGGAVDKDGQVTIYQLDSYIKTQVSERTKGKQSPIVENKEGDAVLFHINKK